MAGASPVGTTGTDPEQTAERGLRELVERLSKGYRTIGEMVYQVLREGILSGALAPGDRLRQETLAAGIGVSRLPVRSALIQLESEGLVEFHPRRGAVVRRLTPEEIAEIYDLRALLEPYALRRSMARMTPERLDRLRALADEADSQDEGDRFLDVRLRFYRELYDAERSPRLVGMIEDLRNRVGRYLLGWRVATRHGEGEHRELVRHVAAGDADAAERSLLGHLARVREGLEAIVGAAAAEPDRRPGGRRRPPRS